MGWPSKKIDVFCRANGRPLGRLRVARTLGASYHLDEQPQADREEDSAEQGQRDLQQ